MHFVMASFAKLVGGFVSRAQYQLDISMSDALKYMSSFFLSRVFLDPSYMTFWALTEYNGSTMFLHGRSIRLLAPLAGEYQPFSSVGFVGDLWANFGWLGVVIGGVAIGFLLQFIQVNFFKRKTLLATMVYVMLVLNSLWIMYGSILSTMVVSVFLLSGLFALFLQIVEGAVRNRAPARGYVSS